MRDVHIAGFAVESDAVIRFRTRDGKVAVGDLLVVMGRYSSVFKAQETVFDWIRSKNDTLNDLDSIEVDKDLFDRKVCNFLNYSNFLYHDPKWNHSTKKFNFFLYHYSIRNSGTK